MHSSVMAKRHSQSLQRLSQRGVTHHWTVDAALAPSHASLHLCLPPAAEGNEMREGPRGLLHSAATGNASPLPFFCHHCKRDLHTIHARPSGAGARRGKHTPVAHLQGGFGQITPNFSSAHAALSWHAQEPQLHNCRHVPTATCSWGPAQAARHATSRWCRAQSRGWESFLWQRSAASAGTAAAAQTSPVAQGDGLYCSCQG